MTEELMNNMNKGKVTEIPAVNVSSTEITCIRENWFIDLFPCRFIFY